MKPSLLRRLLLAATRSLQQALTRRPLRLALQAAAVFVLITVALAVWQAGPGPAMAAGQMASTAASTADPAGSTVLVKLSGSADPAAASVVGSVQSAAVTSTSETAATSGSVSASTTRASSASSTISASTTAATGKATIANTVIPTVTTFKGIDQAISERWVFPLKLEPFTPTIGVFGASRTSSRLHAGIDLYALSGTPVYAMTAGKVQDVLVFYESLMAVDVANEDGTTIRYGELTPAVAIGDTIVQGQLIGKLRSNSDHTCMLHLEIYATVNIAPLTDTTNKSDYPYVPISSRSYRRRRDLVDPSAVWSLMRLNP